jgi:hypothetical protein
MCYNLNQKKGHCTMCGSAKPSEETDASLGTLQGTMEQKHNQRRALAARNMKRQWERYHGDGLLRWFVRLIVRSFSLLHSSLVRSFVRSFVRPFVRPFVRSLVRSPNRPNWRVRSLAFLFTFLLASCSLCLACRWSLV